MAASELIHELIRAHLEGDENRFQKTALQLAASEQRAGHRVVAGRIRTLLEEAKGATRRTVSPTPIARPSSDLRAILAASYPDEKRRDIVLTNEADDLFARALQEQRSADALHRWNLRPRRRFLFYGPPGCGKTLGAAVLAGELGLPLLRVRVEVLFSRYLGETAAHMTAIFDEMSKTRGVYLFDEFEAIGKHRADSQDIGETKRVVSTFLQLVDAEDSESIVVAATNESRLLDVALFRRFDDVIEFPLPGRAELEQLFELRAVPIGLAPSSVRGLAKEALGLSYADVTKAVMDAFKLAVLEGGKRVAVAAVSSALKARRTAIGLSGAQR